ncbi:CG18336, partial [Drosophila busckii]
GFDFHLSDGGWCSPANDMYFRRSVEWVPIRSAGVGRSFPNTYGMVYPRVIGLLPRYGGHVPGEIFDVGRTFGRSTVDAKRWLALNRD